MPVPGLALRRAVPGGFMPLEGVARRCALYGLDDLDPLEPTTSWLARDGGRSMFDTLTAVYVKVVKSVGGNHSWWGVCYNA